MLMAFASTVLAASTAGADLVSTDQISEAMRRLVEDYSCEDVLGTIAASENPFSAATEDFLDMMVLNMFARGYASAKQQSPKVALQELLNNCRHRLSEPFIGASSADR